MRYLYVWNLIILGFIQWIFPLTSLHLQVNHHLGYSISLDTNVLVHSLPGVKNRADRASCIVIVLGWHDAPWLVRSIKVFALVGVIDQVQLIVELKGAWTQNRRLWPLKNAEFTARLRVLLLVLVVLLFGTFEKGICDARRLSITHLKGTVYGIDFRCRNLIYFHFNLFFF